MIFSVYFNRQPLWNAKEIQNVRSERDLSTKANTERIFSQTMPENLFFRSHSFSQTARFIDGGRRCLKEVPTIGVHTFLADVQCMDPTLPPLAGRSALSWRSQRCADSPARGEIKRGSKNVNTGICYILRRSGRRITCSLRRQDFAETDDAAVWIDWRISVHALARYLQNTRSHITSTAMPTTPKAPPAVSAVCVSVAAARKPMSVPPTSGPLM